MGDTKEPILCGAIVQFGPDLLCKVRLDNAEDVQAHLPKNTARLMFRLAPGDRVKVGIGRLGEYVVLGHEWART
jgi:translation initiation factor IF-1